MKLAWERRQIHLRHPWKIASDPGASMASKEKLILRIEHGGKIGWGEASPVSYYQQTIDSAEETLDRATSLLGDDPFALETTLSTLSAHFPDQPATVAAIDGALYDLVGQLLDMPVWKLFGLDPTQAPLSSFSIGIDDPAAVEAKVREAAAFPILKIKVGDARDHENLSALRRAAPDKLLRVDANGVWSPEDVVRRCEALAAFNLELIEQPVARTNDAVLDGYPLRPIAPVYADESCLNADDVLRCRGRYDGINIKLCKCGGLREALKMIHIARSAGMFVMLGCMVETTVGIATAAQLAPLADAIDLDGHLLLADDPFEGVGGEAGRLQLQMRPGLGIVERT